MSLHSTGEGALECRRPEASNPGPKSGTRRYDAPHQGGAVESILTGRGPQVGSRIELTKEIAKVADLLERLLAVLGSVARCEDEIQQLLTYELSVLRVPAHRPQQLLFFLDEVDNGPGKVGRWSRHGGWVSRYGGWVSRYGVGKL
jgi:hypothetical protein